MSESIELAVATNPAIVLLDKEKFVALTDHIEREVDSFVHDLSTAASRKKTAALAYKVSRTKTAIDDAGKDLNSDLRKQTGEVDSARREIRRKLDALKDKARLPLTEWEDAEKALVAAAERQVEEFRAASILVDGDTSESVAVTLAAVEMAVINPVTYADLLESVLDARRAACESLRHSIDRLKQAEADQAELAKLREAAAVREEADKEVKRVAEEKRRKEEAIEAERLAEERRRKAEADRFAASTRESEEKAKRETIRIIEEAADKQALIHDQEVAQLREEKDAAAAEVARQANERRAEEAEVEARAERKAEEEKRLAADEDNRARIIQNAIKALMGRAHIDGPEAGRVIAAIILEAIPGVSIRFV